MAISLVACGSDDGESAGTSTTPAADGDRTTTTITGPEPCDETSSWTTEPEQVQAGSADAIYLLEAGQHDAPECYDQLTFRLNGTGAMGYYVGYAGGSDVRVEGDQLVATAGDAALVVDISAPVQGGPFDRSGHQPGVIFAETVGQVLYPASNTSGLKVVEEVRFAGELEAAGESGSVASFALGVDRQRPFAVSSFVDEDSNTRVLVIRIAH